jgi:SAM-dependent methyltransferase
MGGTASREKRERAASESWLNYLKDKLKDYPNFYAFLINICSPVLQTGKSPKILLDRLPPDAAILNLGSGTRRISSSAINVDIFPYKGVDIVADVSRLPLKEGSIDGIINEVTLEHVSDSRAALGEMQRVLKQGGYLYVVVPFMQGYHPSPGDYHRWTPQGLTADLQAFEAIETGIMSGPTSALLWILQEWLAMALSFNISFLYRVLWVLLMILTFPIKLLDLLFSRYSMAWKIASTFYYLGIKR